MSKVSREMTPAEIRAFISDNQHGVLAFAGDEPYAIPMGYNYRRETFLVGLTSPGLKWQFVEKDHRVCFTICRPRWQTEGKKTACSTVMVKGRLEPLLDRTAYGLSDKISASMDALGIKTFALVDAVLTSRRCTRRPCELFFKNPEEQPPD
jgi:nitroimidazol reductase NimA-like FMN-containing flavoprotein (pyridoxamine 5'-phosphate oxidase superfamily)